MLKNKSRVTVWVTARNVVNTDEIRTKLKVASDRAVYQGGKQWILRNVYNYLINDFASRDEVHLVENTSDLKSIFKSISKIPKWALSALEKNEGLYYVEPDRTFWNQTLAHIVDYLNTQDRDWSRINFPQMEKLVKGWDEELKNQKQGKVNKDDYKHLFNSGQYQWVEILTPEGLKDEGAKMGHCVGGGSYCYKLQKGNIKIFSLRDKNFDNPHVTIEMTKSGAIEQIQGKGNTPQPKYADNVADFLNKVIKPKDNGETIPEALEWGLWLSNGDFISLNKLSGPLIITNKDLKNMWNIDLFGHDIFEGKDIILPQVKHTFRLDFDGLQNIRSIEIPKYKFPNNLKINKLIASDVFTPVLEKLGLKKGRKHSSPTLSGSYFIYNWG